MSNYYVSNCCGAEVDCINIETNEGRCLKCLEPCELEVIEDEYEPKAKKPKMGGKELLFWWAVYCFNVVMLGWIIGLGFTVEDAISRFFVWIYFVTYLALFASVGLRLIRNEK